MIEETFIGLLRSLVVATAAVGFGKAAAPALRAMPVSALSRRLFLLLCVLPIFAPALLTGYAYARWSLPLVHHPLVREFAYVALLVLRIAPAGVILFYFFPPSLADSGRHCLNLAGQAATGQIVWKLRLRALADTPGIVFVGAFLLAFHEFEIASLIGVDAWTVRLFDAHAGGLPWADAMQTAAAPVTAQIILVLTLVWMLKARSPRDAAIFAMARVPGPRQTRVAWWLAAFACGVAALLPLALIGREAFAGIGQLIESYALRKEMAASALFGLSGGILAFGVSAGIRSGTRWMAALPGLCGPLILALAAVRLFQMGYLREFYDSPVPLIVVLAMLLLPLALLLSVLRRRQSARAAAHLAALSGAWRPRWAMNGRGIFGGVTLLCLLAFTELTASAILAPPGMTTVPARLYNLMHYGQNAVLSAMTVTAFLMPLAAAGATWGVLELAVRVSHPRGRGHR